MTPDARGDLFELFEALCEERLTPEQHARLDRLIVDNAEARKLYIEYVALHGMLSWDVAAAASGKLPALPDTAAAVAPVRRSRFQRRTVVTAVIAAALALGVSLLLLNPARDAGAPIEPVAVTATQPLDDASRPPLAPIELGPPRRDQVDQESTRTDDPRIVAAAPRDFAPIDVPLTDDFDPVVAVNKAIADGWNDTGIQAAPVAVDAEWIRRVYLDLAGRIPSSVEAERFFNETAADKREQLIDELLARSETARNFATSWTNLLVGRSENPELDRSGLQHYLQDQFARNRPWSDTVTALITAEGAARENGPANFLLTHLNNEAVPATAVTARCFLGVQVQCTQCHAHPFYRGWGQDQFWELNSFFQQTKVERRPAAGDGAMTLALTNRPVGGPTYYENRNGEMKIAFPKFADTEVDPGETTNRRQELAQLIVAGDHPQLARAFVNRTWAHFFGYGFVNPVDDMGPHNPPSHPALLDRLADEFLASDYDVRALCRTICNSDAYQLTSRLGDAEVIDDPQFGDAPLFSRMYLKPLTAEQLYDSLQVATVLDDDPGRAIANTNAQRQAWIGQFFAAEQTDENCESSTFGGTLPQALTMMNGELVAQAVSTTEETRLSAILKETPDEADCIRRIMLAVLSRYPTRDESTAIREFLRQSVRQQVQSGRVPNARAAVEESLKDVYWACLNSTEFIINH